MDQPLISERQSLGKNPIWLFPLLAGACIVGGLLRVLHSHTGTAGDEFSDEIQVGPSILPKLLGAALCGHVAANQPACQFDCGTNQQLRCSWTKACDSRVCIDLVPFSAQRSDRACARSVGSELAHEKECCVCETLNAGAMPPSSPVPPQSNPKKQEKDNKWPFSWPRIHPDMPNNGIEDDFPLLPIPSEPANFPDAIPKDPNLDQPSLPSSNNDDHVVPGLPSTIPETFPDTISRDSHLDPPSLPSPSNDKPSVPELPAIVPVTPKYPPHYDAPKHPNIPDFPSTIIRGEDRPVETEDLVHIPPASPPIYPMPKYPDIPAFPSTKRHDDELPKRPLKPPSPPK